ncbi:MAG TPA: type II toxin-antitoxin system HicA family toxin [Actinomycetota bacterium]|nr:type II toxin-antitoxin system HicA family toxin [Actinomycetota bacterium]
MVDKRLRHLESLETDRKSCSPEVLQNALRAFGFKRVRQKGSHATWRHASGLKTVVPIHRPVKQFYVEEAISLCKEVMDDESEGGEEK